MVARPDQRRRRAAALAGALLGVLAAATTTATAAGQGGGLPTPTVELATTGNRSELVETIPITTVPAADQQVVMSLGPDQLRGFQPGDRVFASGEVQVSTTCVEDRPSCVGTHYDYNPIVNTQIVLSAAPEAGVPSVPLSEPRQVRCKQRRPHRNHHCTLTLPTLETTVGDGSTLPCPPTACYVNLLVDAWDPSAQAGNVVVAGADRPNGTTVGDKGRLNVIQARAGAPAPSESANAEVLNTTLPVTEPKGVKRRVVYSVPVPAPKAGEVLAFDGSFVSGIAAFGFNAFISSRLVVAESPSSIGQSGIVREVAQFHGKATEANGFNCTKGRSAYRDPCASVKAGATEFTEDAVDASGQPVTLYLNLVAAAKPLLTTDANQYHRVGLLPAAGLRVLRFSP